MNVNILIKREKKMQKAAKKTIARVCCKIGLCKKKKNWYTQYIEKGEESLGNISSISMYWF